MSDPRLHIEFTPPADGQTLPIIRIRGVAYKQADRHGQYWRPETPTPPAATT